MLQKSSFAHPPEPGCPLQNDSLSISKCKRKPRISGIHSVKYGRNRSAEAERVGQVAGEGGSVTLGYIFPFPGMGMLEMQACTGLQVGDGSQRRDRERW